MGVLTFIFLVHWQPVSELARKAPSSSSLLVWSIVSLCRVDVLSIEFAADLFRETLERKVFKGNINIVKTEVRGDAPK